MAKAHGATTNGVRVAVVAGLRTPFAKQGTAYRGLSSLDLGRLVVNELVQRQGIDANEIQQVVYGQVIPTVSAPNIAREIVLGSGLPQDIEAYSVSRACATSYQSTVNVIESIVAGQVDCGISGGADSASDVPITVSNKLRDALVTASKAKNLGQRIKAFRSLTPGDFVPVPPALKEPSTGLTMGESAEKMAKENGISRGAQDEFSHRSHTNAAQAWKSGAFEDEVMPVFVPPRYRECFHEDNLVRQDSDLASYEKLKPVFDRKHGTITAGNSSPLTDGASALLLMKEEKAKALGHEPLGFIRSYAFAALDPRGQMLMGPSYATPAALDVAGMKLSDIDLIDMHEAFAAQVLSNTQAFESRTWAETHLGRSDSIGKIDWDRFNVTGGSISIGHPFAATGARQVSQVLHQLKRQGGGVGLCTACAAGGLGAAMIVESA